MSTRTMVRRTVVTCLSVMIALALTAGPAWAHTSLRSSDPARGATLNAAPTRVSLTFGEAVTVGKSPIAIVGADGTAWSVGAVTVSGATVSAPVEATGPAQRYTIRWSIFSDDGDAISGTIAFTMAVAATPPAAVPAPSTAPSTPPAATSSAAPVPSVTTAPTVAPVAASQPADGGPPAWVWIVVVVVVLALVGGGLALRARRSPRG